MCHWLQPFMLFWRSNYYSCYVYQYCRSDTENSNIVINKSIEMTINNRSSCLFLQICFLITQSNLLRASFILLAYKIVWVKIHIVFENEIPYLISIENNMKDLGTHAYKRNISDSRFAWLCHVLKLTMCWIKYQIIKTVGGTGGVAPYSHNFSTRWRWMVS